MDDAEIAKALLIDGSLSVAKLKILGPPKIVEKFTQMDYNSFNHNHIYKVEIEVEAPASEGYLIHSNLSKFFTNWHIENHNMPRQNKKFRVFNGYKIYPNELINCMLSNPQYVQGIIEPLNMNPFEEIKVEIVALRGTFHANMDEQLAKFLLPNLTDIYVVKDVI